MRALRQEPDRDQRAVNDEWWPEPGIAPGKVTLTGKVKVSRKADAAVRDPDKASALIDRARAGIGVALPAELRSRFESSLGASLDGVRIHTGGAAAEAATALGARAFTVGNDVVFGAGQYDASSSTGMHLIAHEVAHTVQQAGTSSPAHQNKDLEVSEPGDALEHEADAAADAMVAGAEASVSEGNGVARSAIQRDPDPAAKKDDKDDKDGEVKGPKSGTIAGQDFDPGPGAGGCDLHGPGCRGGHDVPIVMKIDHQPTVARSWPTGGSIGYDAIAAGGVTMSSKIGRGGGIPGSAFGKATPKFKSEDLKWTLDGQTVNVTGKVTVEVNWDVQSRGRISLESADEPALGPGNFLQAIMDLTPGGDSAPPRDMFWCQSITEAHEQVHVKEYVDNSGAATTARIAELSAAKLKLPKSDSDKSVQDQLEPLLKELPLNVGRDVLAKFESGGEPRAYSATNGKYKTITDAIKAKAAKLKWDKQAAKDGNKGGYVAPEARPGHRPEDDEGNGGG